MAGTRTRQLSLALTLFCALLGYMAFASSALAQTHLSSLVQQALRAGKPHVDNAETKILNPGKRGQIIDVKIDFNALPPAAVGKLRRVEQIEIWLKAKDGDKHLFSRWWENGKYTLDEAGSMEPSLHRPPGNSPDTALPPGGKALLGMRERILKLPSKNVVAEATYWHGIRNGGQRIRKRHVRPLPKLSWNLPHTASEGAPVPFSWTGSHLGGNHRLVVQRPVGTARTWRTILRLPSNSRLASIPGLPLGKYRFRLADLSGHRVLAQRVAGIAVFGQVTLSKLFGNESNEGVYATSTSSFPYVFGYTVGWNGKVELAFQVELNHCSSVHIGFIPGEHQSQGVGTLTLVQESRDPVSSSAPFDAIGSLDASLVPGQSWAVNIVYKPEYPEYIYRPTMYINGYAVCDSTESFFS